MTLRIPLAKNRFATLLSLDEVLHQILKTVKVLLLVDFNARVGQSDRMVLVSPTQMASLL